MESFYFSSMTASGKPTDRQIRVFISSTFRDMQAERDHLVKFIFPQLRKLCESRGVTWGEVDLRWGVTDEQAAEGKVLPICLEEIKRCRHYFIGLLGERYGWIPETLPSDLVEREPWLKEHLNGKTSVTELEILHGVLRNPKMAGHAFFYLRDPAYVNSVAEKDRKDFTAENAKDADKLSSLKEKIRQSGFPVRENYPDPKVLGELVLADLTKVINDTWPEGSQPDPLDREAMDHEAYAQSRERVYIGRQEYFDRLDAHAAANDTRPLVVLGESGSGKSALLANWVARYRQAHPDALVLQHYIGATPYSADWAAMLRRLMGEFKRRLGLQQDIPDQPDALRSAFPNWLYMAAAKGRVVLVLDALNQLEDRDGAPDLVWLPPVLPENVRLIVSTLPGRPLDEIQKRNWPTLKVEPLSADERKELVRLFLKDYGRNLSPKQLERITNTPASANPLYLRVLLDELRVFGVYEKLDERIGYYLDAESPYALYEKVIARWEQDYEGDSDLVADTLSLLWAARRGLTETELLQALGKDGEPLPRAKWSPLFLAMSDALVSRNGLLTFAHDFLRTAVENAYLPTEKNQRQTHMRLADYFELQPASARRIDELPWQLAEATEWQRLQNLLVERAFFNDAWNRNQFEVKAYWAQIESGSNLRMVEAYHRLIETPETESNNHYVSILSALLADTGHFEASLKLRSLLVERYRLAGNLDDLQVALGNQALILKDRGNLDGAMALHKEEEMICRQIGKLDGLQRTLGNQAIILQMRGELDQAMGLHTEKERICRLLNNSNSLSTSLGNQALILKERGDLDGAMTLCKETERISRQFGNIYTLAASLDNQASILEKKGELVGALTTYKQAESISRQIGNLDGLQTTLNNQALFLKDHGDLDEAMALNRESEGICRRLGKLVDLQATLANQAFILRKRGDLDGAIALHKEVENICRKSNNLKILSTCLSNHALILFDRMDLDGAMALLEEVEQICRKAGNLKELETTLGKQSAVFKKRGDLERAMILQKEMESICRRLGSLYDLQATLLNQAVILEVRGDLDAAMVLLKESEKICRKIGHIEGLRATLGKQAVIMQKRGHLDEAMALHKEEEKVCRQLNNSKGLSTSLDHQALILKARGDLDGAMALHKQAEIISRKMGDFDGIQATLNNQALILHMRGDLNGALVMHNEIEQICRRLDNNNGLAISLINRALVLSKMGRSQEAISLANESYQIAVSHGYIALVEQIKSLLYRLNQAAQNKSLSQSATPAPIAIRKPPQKLTGIIELAKHNPSRIQEIADRLKREDFKLFMEFARWIQSHNEEISPRAEQKREENRVEVPPGNTPETTQHPPQAGTTNFRDAAARCFRQGQWEAAETYLEKLLQQGEPVETVAPDLITALLNAHETLSPATVTRIETLLAQLSSAGHTALATELRQKLDAKLPKKSKWKFW